MPTAITSGRPSETARCLDADSLTLADDQLVDKIDASQRRHSRCGSPSLGAKSRFSCGSTAGRRRCLHLSAESSRSLAQSVVIGVSSVSVLRTPPRHAPAVAVNKRRDDSARGASQRPCQTLARRVVSPARRSVRPDRPLHVVSLPAAIRHRKPHWTATSAGGNIRRVITST